MHSLKRYGVFRATKRTRGAVGASFVYDAAANGFGMGRYADLPLADPPSPSLKANGGKHLPTTRQRKRRGQTPPSCQQSILDPENLQLTAICRIVCPVSIPARLSRSRQYIRDLRRDRSFRSRAP